MIIAIYNQDDAYWTENMIKEYKENNPDSDWLPEPGEYDQIQDENNWILFEDEVKEIFSKRKFPLELIARRSNWQGQDGTVICGNIDQVIQKVTSFKSNSIELHRTRGGKLFFVMGGTHDVPTGFTIEVNPIN